MHGTQLDLADEISGKIDGRFHGASLLVFWLIVKSTNMTDNGFEDRSSTRMSFLSPKVALETSLGGHNLILDTTLFQQKFFQSLFNDLTAGSAFLLTESVQII